MACSPGAQKGIPDRVNPFPLFPRRKLRDARNRQKKKFFNRERQEKGEIRRIEKFGLG